MEDAKRKSNRVLTVERGFEWSRLEGELMASAYERALPFVRAAPGGSQAEQPQIGSDGQAEATRQEQRYATGA
jgi:hypothetical protein